MSRDVAVITSRFERATVSELLPGITVRTRASHRDGLHQVIVATLDDLTNAGRFAALEKLVDETKTASSSAVSMVIRAWQTNAAAPDATSRSLASFRVLSQVMTSELSRLRRTPPTFVATDAKALRRLVRAHKLDAASALIASVELEGRDLLVWSCEPKLYRVSAQQVAALAKLNEEALADFELSDSGNRIHWPHGDIDLNLDSIREIVDPGFRKANESRARQEAAKYGRAIRALRDEKRLTQKDIKGLSDREVRRLESASVMPHASTLRKLADAHRMDVKTYVAELAKRARSFRLER